jgi:hypothetical protein
LDHQAIFRRDAFEASLFFSRIIRPDNEPAIQAYPSASDPTLKLVRIYY